MSCARRASWTSPSSVSLGSFMRMDASMFARPVSGLTVHSERHDSLRVYGNHALTVDFHDRLQSIFHYRVRSVLRSITRPPTKHVPHGFPVASAHVVSDAYRLCEYIDLIPVRCGENYLSRPATEFVAFWPRFTVVFNLLTDSVFLWFSLGIFFRSFGDISLSLCDGICFGLIIIGFTKYWTSHSYLIYGYRFVWVKVHPVNRLMRKRAIGTGSWETTKMLFQPVRMV